MSRQSTFVLLGAFVAFAAALIVPQGLNLTMHTGDALHMIAIVERMASGELPHVDFMTPIGVLAFAPIALFARWGLSAGEAFLTAQVLVAAVVLAMAVYVGRRRVPSWAMLAFGAMILILCTALIHGEARQGVSVSMHYNRWAWALAFVAVLASAFAPRRQSVLDGVIVGLALAMLALIKVTFFVTIAPVVVLFGVLTGQGRMLAGGAGTGLLIAAMMTAVHGLGYWDAYLNDLLIVAGSDLRAQPGIDFQEVLRSPPYIGATLAVLAMALVLRLQGDNKSALMTIVLLPVGAYITYQNFGNDPQWLMLLALMLGVWAAARTDEKTRLPLIAGAVACAAFVTPSYMNMAVSPFRHLMIPTAQYTPVLAGGTLHQDVRVSRVKANRIQANTPLEGITQVAGMVPSDPPEFMGEPLRNCRTEPQAAYFASIAGDLAARELAQGGRIFAADVYGPYWLFGNHARLRGGAPWYYDNLSGLADADYVLVPTCPVLSGVRNLILRDLADVPMRKIVDAELYTLYAR